MKRSAICVAICAAAAGSVHGQEYRRGAPVTLPKMDVVATLPLPGLDLPASQVPANIQSLGRSELGAANADDVAGILANAANSVNLNSAQGNPYQQDVTFRGFVASPLLGTPQGMSVFLDGVRINEPFGDVVNWDLLPRSAIAEVQLIPGSNPVFGLNTLGGALAIYTKSGDRHPGAAVQLTTGSHGRRGFEFEAGDATEQWHYFAAGNVADDAGWAEHNASRVRQLFGKVGYRTDETQLDLSLLAADNRLNGTQTLPLSFLDRPREAYTYPDRNDNRVHFLRLQGEHSLNDRVLLAANAYYRRYRNDNLSSNVNDQFVPGEDEAEALNAQSRVDQRGYGAGAQLSLHLAAFGLEHRLGLGAGIDIGDAVFRQSQQDARFGADRGTIATGPFEPTADVETRNAYAGVYATDTMRIGADWALTLSGRYNRARVTIADRSGTQPGLDGHHRFARFNPSVGATWSPVKYFTGYLAYNEGMRAPTPIELTCADAGAPCSLPNLFLADPPLNRVVSKTFEGGARGRFGGGTTWSAAAYRTDLVDDIQFINSGSGAANLGFFQNVGRTRRQGLELSAATRLGKWSATLRYAYLDATFQSGFEAHSPNNSAADAGGAIVVRPGNRIPGLPRHTLKLRVETQARNGLDIGASVHHSTSIYARGDESNRDRNGQVPGYTLVNLDARMHLSKSLSVFAGIDNVFDRRVHNFALLGSNVFTGEGRSFGPAGGNAPVAEQFRAVGAPREFRVGLRYVFR